VYQSPLLCGFNVPVKGLKLLVHRTVIAQTESWEHRYKKDNQCVFCMTNRHIINVIEFEKSTCDTHGLEARLLGLAILSTHHISLEVENKKLSCRREAARCFVSLNILLNDLVTKSLKIIPFESLGTVSYSQWLWPYLYRFDRHQPATARRHALHRAAKIQIVVVTDCISIIKCVTQNVYRHQYSSVGHHII